MTNRMTDMQVWQEISSRVEVRLRQAGVSWYCVDSRFASQVHDRVERRVLRLLGSSPQGLYAGPESNVVSLTWDQAKEDYSG